MLLHLKTGDGDLLLIKEPALLTRCTCDISPSPMINACLLVRRFYSLLSCIHVIGWEACGQGSSCASRGAAAERRKSWQETAESGIPRIASCFVPFFVCFSNKLPKFTMFVMSCLKT